MPSRHYPQCECYVVDSTTLTVEGSRIHRLILIKFCQVNKRNRFLTETLVQNCSKWPKTETTCTLLYAVLLKDRKEGRNLHYAKRCQSEMHLPLRRRRRNRSEITDLENAEKGRSSSCAVRPSVQTAKYSPPSFPLPTSEVLMISPMIPERERERHFRGAWLPWGKVLITYKILLAKEMNYFSKPLHSVINQTNQVVCFDQRMKLEQSECLFDHTLNVSDDTNLLIMRAQVFSFVFSLWSQCSVE